MRKYNLSDTDIKEVDGRVLHRVIYTEEFIESFTDFNASHIKAEYAPKFRKMLRKSEAYIESEANLSQEDWCIACCDAMIYDDAVVCCNAILIGGRVYEHAVVGNVAAVRDSAEVYGYAEVFGNAIICGGAKVYGNAKVFDRAYVSDNAKVYNEARVYGQMYLAGDDEACNDEATEYKPQHKVKRKKTEKK